MHFLERNQRIFVYEDNFWAVKGRYTTAVEDDDNADWKVLDDQFCLRLLIVGVYFYQSFN
jgi:hypothetical protein